MAFMDRTRDYWDTLRRQRFGSRPSLMTPDSRGQQQPEPEWRRTGQQADMGVSNILQGMKQPWNRWQGNAVQPTPPTQAQGLVGPQQPESKIRVPEQKESPGLLKRIGAATAAGGGAMSAAASRPGASFWEALGAFGPQFSDVYTENQRYLAEQEQRQAEEDRRVRAEDRIVEDRELAATERTRLATAQSELASGLNPTDAATMIAMGPAGLAWGQERVRTQNQATTARNYLDNNTDRAMNPLGSDKIDFVMSMAPEHIASWVIQDQENQRLYEGTRDSLAFTMHNGSQIEDLTPDEISQIDEIAGNEVLAPIIMENYLRKDPLTVIDLDSGEVVVMRGEEIVQRFPAGTSEEEAVAIAALVEGAVTAGQDYQSDRSRRKLAAFDVAIEAVDGLDASNFGLAGWKRFTRGIEKWAGAGNEYDKAIALQNAWRELGITNLDFLKGSTTDFEYGEVIGMEGNFDLSKEALLNNLTARLRTYAGGMERNNRLLHEKAKLAPEDFLGLGVQFNSHDVPDFLWKEMQTRLDSRPKERDSDGILIDPEARWLEYLMSGEQAYTGRVSRTLPNVTRDQVQQLRTDDQQRDRSDYMSRPY